ncbi:hypothetical protein, partial [Ardenticatena maritima]
MKRFVKVFFALGLLLALATTVWAATIIVDGDREATWSSIPVGQPDANEGTISDDVDINLVKWTNDTTNMYFMIDTQGTPRLSSGFNPTRVYICLNTDNNTTTGSTYNNCNNQSGFDRYILINGASSVEVYDGSFNLISNGTLGYNTSATTPVIEVSVALSDLGFGPGNCPSQVPTVVYYDNGTTDPDDNTPDSGTFNTNCGSPTAVTLETFGGTATGTDTRLLLAGA